MYPEGCPVSPYFAAAEWRQTACMALIGLGRCQLFQGRTDLVPDRVEALTALAGHPVHLE
jgi:hypothetical protein